MRALITRHWQALVLLLATLVSSVAGAATPSATVIKNTASISWSVEGTAASPVSAFKLITVSPYTLGPDLAVSITGPAKVAPGANMIWTAVVTDTGPGNGNGAQVTLTVPPGVTNVSGVCVVLTSGACGAVTVGTPTAAGTPVTVTLPNLPVNGRVEITLRGKAPAAAGTMNTQAQVALAGQIDPTPADNSATVQTQVLAGAATTGTLSGRVWLDVNHDRIFNTNEALLEGFTIRVYDAAGTTLVKQVTTGANGAYTITGLPAGTNYQVEFRDRAGTVVFGLPVTTEGTGTPPGFASTLSCANLAETKTPNIVMPFTTGNCYSLTSGGSTTQVQRTGRIALALQPGDNVIEQSLPLDPSGVVYDSVTRQPIAGATVTFNGPAGYDPALHLLGGVANQSQVTGAEGYYQFLLVSNAPAGNYSISVTPPAAYTSPSKTILPSGTLDPTGLGLGGIFPVQVQATPPTGNDPTTHYFTFALALGDPNVVNNHIPLDPVTGPGGQLVLRKTASKGIAAVGDFLQYQLQLSNPGTAPVTGVTVVDRLPAGFRYRAGTAQIGGVSAAPAISADGRTLTFNVGNVLAGASQEIKYVTEVTAGTSLGDAINTAQGLGAGNIRSLVARVTVNIKEDLFRSRTILMGRVIEVGNTGPTLAQAGAGAVPVVSNDAGLCNPNQFFGKGVEGARIYMEDGTYIRTDKEGKWHLEGVKPGTHVVQLDVKSLPDGYEPVLCEDNTRHAGRAYSQFVNVRGGSLWRADFYVRNTGKSATGYEVGHRMIVTPEASGAKVKLEVKGVTAAAQNLSMTMELPQGMRYTPGSARLNGAAAAEPQIMDSMLVFRVGDNSGKWAKTLNFELAGAMKAGASIKAMSNFQSADGESRRPPPVSVTLDATSSARQTLVSKSEIIQYNQIVKQGSPTVIPDTAPVAAQPSVSSLNIYAPGSEKFDGAWLSSAAPGLEVVYPAADFIPGINSTKIFVKHHPAQKIKVTMNGVPVHALASDGSDHDTQRGVALSRWGGVGLISGSNKIVAVAVDESGKEVGRAERVVHFSGAGVEGRFVTEASTLVADGRTAPVIAVRIFDETGKPVRHGIDGDLAISAPYQSFEVAQNRDARPLLNDIGNKARWRVTDDGLALIKLQPTTTSGEVSLTLNFPGRAPQIIRAWLKPELREWILVGLGEGTIGHRKVSGNLENLPADLADDKLWKDGRIAFYGKGQVKGDVLMTIAYDTDKTRGPVGRPQNALLGQALDRRQYYTIYGDTTSAQRDAPSLRKLYLKIEKNQFYVLFGDFDTGMNVTELSRYSRTINGLKAEFRGQNISVTAFGTKTAQAFVKDELRPDGTSGNYRLSRANILPNSEKVTIETRDRFRNEIIVKATPMSRGVDYDIDYTLGTMMFRTSVVGKDQNFNPNYIVVDYESEDPKRDERITAGGRVAVRTTDGKAEVGVSAVHEGTIGARGDLKGVDAKLQIDDKTRVRAEYAQTNREVPGAPANASGNAYLVEARRQDANVAATAYVRGQQGAFGLGQQAAALSGTTKMGGDVSVKLSPEVRVNALAVNEHSDNAGVKTERTQVEGRVNYTRPENTAYVGARSVRDKTATGETLTSNQLIAGGGQKMLDGRVNLRLDSEFNLASTSSASTSADFPHRVRVGADYRVNEKISLFVDHEFAFNNNNNTSTTRVGTKSKLWDGADSASSLNMKQTSDGPVISTTSSMTQTMKLTSTLSVNGGLDRTSTLRKPASSSLNPNVPAAQGTNATGGGASQSILPPAPGLASATPVEDYTAVFGGATWKNGPWGATGRAEYRHGDTTGKTNIAGSVHRDIKTGEAVAATALYTDMHNKPVGGPSTRSKTTDLRLSYAFRPVDSLWIILSRLDYIQEESDQTGGHRSRRLVTNNNVNHQYNRNTQIAFQYGAKYVFDTFDRTSVAGFTDLIGGEMRYDFGNRFDIGAHASVLHSWQSNVTSPSYGLSVGFAPVTNLWLGVGYNFAGFRDRDFASANATAKGVFLYARMKLDQDSLRNKDVSTSRQVTFEEMSK